MKKCVYAALIVCIAVFVSCGKSGDGSRELKLSLILGDNSEWYHGALKFSELLEEHTNGAYRDTASARQKTKRYPAERTEEGKESWRKGSSIPVQFISFC